MQTSLDLVAPALYHSRGAIAEGDVFSVLASSPYVVRGGEFAVADGALDCSRTYGTASYAMRYWDLNDRAADPEESSDLLAFDVKSSSSGIAGQQTVWTSIAQRRRVSFYIARLAADPTWVEIIPNYQQQAAALDTRTDFSEAESREHVFNFTRQSAMVPRTYGGIDPSGSPYRMPLALLPEAMRRIRLCCQKEGAQVYVNPWTDVAFPEWHPVPTKAAKWFRPRENGGVFTAHMAVMQLFQSFNFHHQHHAEDGGKSIEVDFVGLQPSLGDFKFIVRKPASSGAELLPKSTLSPDGIESRNLGKFDSLTSQYIVQHKMEGRRRGTTAKLTDVAIARIDRGKQRYYFHAFERLLPIRAFSFSLRANTLAGSTSSSTSLNSLHRKKEGPGSSFSSFQKADYPMISTPLQIIKRTSRATSSDHSDSIWTTRATGSISYERWLRNTRDHGEPASVL